MVRDLFVWSLFPSPPGVWCTLLAAPSPAPSSESCGQSSTLPYVGFTTRTYDLYGVYDVFPLDNLDVSGHIDSLSVQRYDIAHVAGSETYNLHGLGHVFLGSDLCYTDPAQHLITAEVRIYR